MHKCLFIITLFRDEETFFVFVKIIRNLFFFAKKSDIQKYFNDACLHCVVSILLFRQSAAVKILVLIF